MENLGRKKWKLRLQKLMRPLINYAEINGNKNKRDLNLKLIF